MTTAERALVFSLCEKLYTVSQHLSYLAERKDKRSDTTDPTKGSESTMLVLSRKLGERIHIGSPDISITIVEIDRGKIRLGIEAPRGVGVWREEVAPWVTGEPDGKAKCPHGSTDTYVCTVETDRLLAVEAIHEAIAKHTSEPIYQEELTERLAFALDCKVTTVGWHSGIKTTATSGEREDPFERGQR